MTDSAQLHERYTEGPLLSPEAARLRSQAAVTRHPPYCPCPPPLAVSPAPGAIDPSIQVSSDDYGPYRPPRRSRRVGAPDFAPTMTCWTTPVPPAPTASFPNTSICRSATGCPWRKDQRHDRVQGDGVRDKSVAPAASPSSAGSSRGGLVSAATAIRPATSVRISSQAPTDPSIRRSVDPSLSSRGLPNST